MLQILTPELLMSSVVFFSRKKKAKSKHWFVEEVLSPEGDDLILRLVHRNGSLQTITTSVILNAVSAQKGCCDRRKGLYMWKHGARQINVQVPLKKP